MSLTVRTKSRQAAAVGLCLITDPEMNLPKIPQIFKSNKVHVREVKHIRKNLSFNSAQI